MDSEFAQQAHRDYVESQVLSARPAERVYLLYKVAIESVNVAIERLRDGDIFARGRAVNKAHEAVDELNFALDHTVGAKFTRTLAELYIYVQQQLVRGHSQKSERAFQEALSVLTTLADTWKEVVARTCGDNSSHQDPQADSRVVTAEESGSRDAIEVSETYAAYNGSPEGSATSRGWSG
jgi:flagellar protein FliS